MTSFRRAVAFVLLLIALCARTYAQGPGPGSGPVQGAQQARQPGTLAAGPIWIHPYIHLGTVGWDTNVFYTPRDSTTQGRTADFFASGGPGLNITLPVRNSFRVFGDGWANYYYYAKTEELRTFGGSAGGGFEWSAASFTAGANAFYQKTFERPGYEVDQRVTQEGWNNRIYLNYDGGGMGARFQLRPSFRSERRTTPTGEYYLGQDLSRTLTQDMYLARVEAAYRITGKTSLIAVGDYQIDRFPKDPARDTDSNRVGGGFAIASDTRLYGRVEAGIRFFRPRNSTVDSKGSGFYTNSEMGWIFGPKTRLYARVTADTYFSAFQSTQGLPTNTNWTYELRLLRRITEKINFDLWTRWTTLKSDVPLMVLPPEGGPPTAIVRSDVNSESGAFLSYTIWKTLHAGVSATYSNRNSNYSDFGVDGLLVGLRVEYAPPSQISVR
jgi:hypothetical protein